MYRPLGSREKLAFTQKLNGVEALVFYCRTMVPIVAATNETIARHSRRLVTRIVFTVWRLVSNVWLRWEGKSDFSRLGCG